MPDTAPDYGPRAGGLAGFPRRNPPLTAAGLGGALAVVAYEGVQWGLDSVQWPDSFEAALYGLAWVVAGLVGAAVGKLAQHWTYPAEKVEEYLLDAERALHDVAPHAAAVNHAAAAAVALSDTEPA